VLGEHLGRNLVHLADELEQRVVGQVLERVLALRDVARVELGSQSYDLFGRLDGKPTTLVLVYLASGSNALDTRAGIDAALESLERSFPAGVKFSVPYDTTIFIETSVEEVVHTLFEAIVLVLVVVFIFLQSWRATLVPLLAVPVSIVGTFAGMKLLGFSINSLTLFGLVLAIGIVVDDAIVVVENVERLMHEKALSVRDATIEAMQEVTGPVIAIVLVLGAVFVPVAFLGGITGQLYKQFAVTVAISVVFSGIVALTLSPALAALLLQHAGLVAAIVATTLISSFAARGASLFGMLLLGIGLAAGSTALFVWGLGLPLNIWPELG
jgi:multidrug efflux pump subunit AcrB